MENKKRQKFYKSKKWEAFRKVAIDQATDAEGFVRCAVCGKPIVQAYDLIVHHKKELTETNVDDATVSLNLDNVECVHFKCHNMTHERFGYGGSRPKKVYIVWGAPCSGKSTWVKNAAQANDLIVDVDRIWECVSTGDLYVKSNDLRSVVFEVRDRLYDIVKYRSGKWGSAYVIAGVPQAGERERLKQRVGADDLIFIDTDKELCLARAEERPSAWKDLIREWFDKFQPPL